MAGGRGRSIMSRASNPGEARAARWPEISLVLPVFNEAEGIVAVLREADAALGERFARHEIVVVDDGSVDSTPALLRELGGELDSLRVFTQPANLGYAAALIRGFAAARCETIVYTDADGQFDLADLDVALPLLEPGVELVAGFRARRADPLLRRFASAGFNHLARWLLPIRARDIDCAFKLFRRSFFDKVRLSSTGFLIDSEIYARARLAGVEIRQLPVRHRPRRAGRSTVRFGAVGKSFRELLALRRRLRLETRASAAVSPAAASSPSRANPPLAH